MSNRSVRNHLTTTGALLAAASLLGACGMASNFDTGRIVGGTTKQIREVEPVGGFLPSPELLQAGGPGRSALTYRNSELNLSRYNSLILEPVSIWTGPSSPVASLPEEQRQVLANTFTADLNDALRTKCRMTRRSGPGVARIRLALVDATTPNAALNTVATYAPYVSTAYSVASVGLNKGVGYFAGTATIEGYATDSTNGTVLWQAVDKRGGTTALIKNTLDTQLDVHLAFQAWSKSLLAGLQQLGICTT